MFRNILCLKYKGLLNEIKPLTVSSGYFVKKESYNLDTTQNDKDEILLDMSCKDNMALILETRLLQTFVKP